MTMNEYSLRQTQSQNQKMMPQTMQSLQLLSMPVIVLKSYLSSIVLDNPFLDACPEECVVTGIFRLASKSISFREEIYSMEGQSLYDYLRFQTELYPFTNNERTCALRLISYISPSGYLDVSLDNVSLETGFDYAFVERILGVIQGFSPLGVGARNLGECLRLQADTSFDDYGVLVQLLDDDLPALAEHKLTYVSRKYKISKERVQKIVDYMLTLNPKPGGSFGGTRFTPYVIPDAQILLTGQGLEIQVEGGSGTLVTFDPDYMNDVTDKEAAAFLRHKRSEAINLINSLDMRSKVLELIVNYLSVEQRDFFYKGISALKPLTQKKAAYDLGLSASTISRGVKDKYIGTPFGCIPLSNFFTGSLDGGGSVAQAKSAICELIGNEDKAAPISDLDISMLLSSRGISVSRRTVAKYRSQLGLGSQSERIRYG